MDQESIHNSFVEGSVFSMAAGSACSEESGWTTYIEDFTASQGHQKQEPGVFPCSSAVSGSSSMISDAASFAVASKPPEERRTQLRLRRRNKRKWLLDDGGDDGDSLQDTASSSPVDSPKVIESSCLITNPNKKDGHCRDAAQMGNVERSTDECAELKNRGLCLVPLSMLVEYLE